MSRYPLELRGGRVDLDIQDFKNTPLARSSFAVCAAKKCEQRKQIGIGDEAFWSDARTLHVRKGRRVVVVHVSGKVKPGYESKFQLLARAGLAAPAT